MKMKLFVLSLVMSATCAQATQYICQSPTLSAAGKPLDVYHIHTDAKWVRHFQHGKSGYALLRNILGASFRTEIGFETLPGKTMIFITKEGYSSELTKYDNESFFKFTDSYAGHKNFPCKSKN